MIIVTNYCLQCFIVPNSYWFLGFTRIRILSIDCMDPSCRHRMCRKLVFDFIAQSLFYEKLFGKSFFSGSEWSQCQSSIKKYDKQLSYFFGSFCWSFLQEVSSHAKLAWRRRSDTILRNFCCGDLQVFVQLAARLPRFTWSKKTVGGITAKQMLVPWSSIQLKTGSLFAAPMASFSCSNATLCD